MLPGAIVPRVDTDQELYVAVVSNVIHLAAATGRVITCPFVPGKIPGDAMAMVTPVDTPAGVVLPELVQWLPASALGEPIGNIGRTALSDVTATVAALVT